MGATWSPERHSPPLPELSEEEEELVLQGLRLQKQTRDETGGGGFSVQEIHAPADLVWQKLRALEEYPEMIKTVRRSAIYEETDESVKAKITVSRFRIPLYVEFSSNPPAMCMPWKLDTNHRNILLKESHGFWLVEPTAEQGTCRVWFSVSATLRSGIPKVIERIAEKLGLYKASNWVKEEMEKEVGQLSTSTAAAAETPQNDPQV